MLELQFPRLITVANSRSILQCCNRALRSQSDVLFDFSKTEFLTPFGVTVLAGTISKCLDDKKVYYRKPAKDETAEWLSSISFTRFFKVDRIGAKAKRTGIQLRQLDALEPIFIETLLELIDSKVNLSKGVHDSIRMSVQELLTNAFDHSKSDIGCFVCAQFTPHSQLIRVSVTDFGIGILRSLKTARDYSNLKTSHEAITLAVEEGVSSRKKKAAGLGLPHIRRFTRVNKARMTVISGDGKVVFYPKDIEQKPVPINFPGTTIELAINADKEGLYFLTSEEKYLF